MITRLTTFVIKNILFERLDWFAAAVVVLCIAFITTVAV